MLWSIAQIVNRVRYGYPSHTHDSPMRIMAIIDVIRQGYRTLTRMHFSKIAHAQSILVVCVWSVHKCFTKHNRVWCHDALHDVKFQRDYGLEGDFPCHGARVLLCVRDRAGLGVRVRTGIQYRCNLDVKVLSNIKEEQAVWANHGETFFSTLWRTNKNGHTYRAYTPVRTFTPYRNA